MTIFLDRSVHYKNELCKLSSLTIAYTTRLDENSKAMEKLQKKTRENYANQALTFSHHLHAHPETIAHENDIIIIITIIKYY